MRHQQSRAPAAYDRGIQTERDGATGTEGDVRTFDEPEHRRRMDTADAHLAAVTAPPGAAT